MREGIFVADNFVFKRATASRELRQEPLKQSTNSSDLSGSTEAALEGKCDSERFSRFAGKVRVKTI